jgi:hypothetical protein
MTTTYRTSRSFSKLNDAGFAGFSGNVITKMTNNAGYPNPIVPLTTLTNKRTSFVLASDAAANGDRVAIALRNTEREGLDNLLRQQAAYVESVAGGDLALLLSSGFEAQSSSRTQIPLSTPEVLGVENPGTTKLALRLSAVELARAYEVRISYGTNGWQSAGVFTQARRIVLENLTPGTLYNLQARAIGGSTGSSEWSDPVSHMAL